MLGHKIGTLTDFFYLSPPLTRWILMAVLNDDQFAKGGGYGGDIDEDGVDFYKKKLGDLNWILVTMKTPNKFVVQFGVKKELKNVKPEDPVKHFINTRLTYAINLNTMDVYDSEYAF